MKGKGILHWVVYRRPGRLLLALLAGLCCSFHVGCGAAKVAEPAIAFAEGTLAPPASVVANSSVQFAAMVTNDPSSMGVSWMLRCNSSNISDCGTISRHTASGVPAVYQAPLKVPPGETVRVIANSSAYPQLRLDTVFHITPIQYGPVEVAFPADAPSSVVSGRSVSLTPVVTNDHLNDKGDPMGVTWGEPSCGTPGFCGKLQPVFVAGGSISYSATYTAPPIIPDGGSVVVTAVSVADPSRSATKTVTVTPAPVEVTISPAPPAAVAAGNTIELGALVTNDLSKKGVDWSATCASGTVPCGSFNLTHTPSSDDVQAAAVKLTTYTAPCTVESYTVPCPPDTVTLTATSTADPSKTFSVTIAVNSVALRNDLLNGKYAFLLTGVNLFGTSALAGSLEADGHGRIVQAEESAPGQATMSVITGTYFIGSDGRGAITLSGLPAGNTVGWHNGQQRLKVTMVDSTHAVVEEFDGTGTYRREPNHGYNLVYYGATLGGSLDLQKPVEFAVPPSGKYAFAASGVAGTSVYAGYFGGVVSVDDAGKITDFILDRYYGGKTDCVTPSAAPSPGCVSIAGQGSFATVNGNGHGIATLGPYTLDFYVIDSGHFVLLANRSGDKSGLTAGHLYAQPAPGTPLTGNYVFTMAGSTPITNLAGTIVVGSSPQALGGWFSCDATGRLAGYLDSNMDGAQMSAPVSGTCAMDAAGNGRGTLIMNGATASKFAVYPTADHGVLLLQLDQGKGSVGAAYAQSADVSVSSLQGSYAGLFQRLGTVDSTRSGASSGTLITEWEDLTGLLTADGSGGLTGKLDLDQTNGTYFFPTGPFWVQTPDLATTGTINSGPQGRFTGRLDVGVQLMMGPPLLTGATGIMPQIFYVVDGSRVLTLESGTVPATGQLEKQTF